MKTLLPYIYDFLSILCEDESTKSKIRRIILFGSVATGEADEESDVDIFVDVWSKNDVKDVENGVKETEKRFYVVSGKKWELLGIKIPIKCVIGMLEDPTWKGLRTEILGTGILLYGKFEQVEKGLKHYAIFNYSISGLKQNKKMDFLRKLFGYKTVKGKKRYVKSGLLESVGGAKLGPNTILVPVENARKVQKFLGSFGVTPEIREAWLKY